MQMLLANSLDAHYYVFDTGTIITYLTRCEHFTHYCIFDSVRIFLAALSLRSFVDNDGRAVQIGAADWHGLLLMAGHGPYCF